MAELSSARSPEPPQRSSWKQKLSLLKRREASQVIIDAATRDEEVEFSNVGRSFVESIDTTLGGIGAAEWNKATQSNTRNHQRVQTPVQRYGNDSFEDLLSATGNMMNPVDEHSVHNDHKEQQHKEHQHQHQHQRGQSHSRTKSHHPNQHQHQHHRSTGRSQGVGDYTTTPSMSGGAYSPTSSDLTSKFDVGQYSTPPRP